MTTRQVLGAAVPDPFAPAWLGPFTLRNRIVKAATFEGLTRDHVVNDALVAFHRNGAAGGVGMTTLAYCAVAPDGCGTPNELVLTPEVTPGLARLADAVHAEGAAASAQLGTPGRWPPARACPACRRRRSSARRR